MVMEHKRISCAVFLFMLVTLSFAEDLKLHRMVVVNNACTAEDALITEKGDLREKLIHCSTNSNLAVAQCVEQLGLSTGCSLCFAKEAQCLQIHCSSSCASPSSDACAICHFKHCALASSCAKSSAHLVQD